MNATPQGFAIFCDQAGLYELVRDEGRICREGETSFLKLVDAASAEKAQNFLDAIHKDKAAFGWELNVPIRNRPTTFQFAGTQAGERALIIAGATRSDLSQLSEELMAMNSEQSTALRNALKDLSLFQRERAARDAEMFDEMSRLNNELVTLQRELHRKNHELEKLNNLKNTFLGMASHDLRKPLGIAQMMIENLVSEEDGPVNEKQKLVLGNIAKTCRQATRQLNDFLDIAQIESGRLKLDPIEYSLGHLVASRLDIHRKYAAAKSIAIDLANEPNLPEILLDPDRVGQVIDNLIENAIKYSPANTAIHVATTRKDNGVAFTVSDAGPGLTSDQISQLFHPFQGVGSKTTGGERSSGLGLAIVKAIMTGHKGRISVTSVPPNGAKFEAWFPLAS